MQGIDFAAVASGAFDPGAIERAADGTRVTPLGAPLVKSKYAGRTLYTSQNVGFVVMTAHTVLFGNETGMRRALDRIQRGQLGHSVPPWMGELVTKSEAAVAGGFELRDQPTVAAAAAQFPFLNGVQSARVLGNFRPPGMNVAGTLSYADAQSATNAEQSVRAMHSMLTSYSFVTSLLGIGQPIQQLQVQTLDRDLQFVLGLSTDAVGQVIEQLGPAIGLPGGTVEATRSPSVAPVR
jgi:hypothetical protein